ncbi:MAG TPA: DUF2490 domain-containing protein [Caldithrix abyssi]|uniref:DUF2490 domain-containing protein n=1 Tax=Caldithrix abyssi TaxID=187145 RepID=A0A7V1LNV2_CALAY|nr:DUF2490 domain-containing protein [Caldithrix abyssi]
MKRIIFLGFFLFYAFAAVNKVAAFQSGDQQLWNTESIEGGLSSLWKVKLEEEFRFGNNASDLYYTHTDMGVTYKLTTHLSLGVNFREIFEKKNGVLIEENRPHVNAIVKWKWLDFKLSDRSRLEYRILKNKANSWRYRNKLGLVYPAKWSAMEIQPYLADEIFIDFAAAEYNRNRLYAGFKARLSDKLGTDIFYLWQSSKKNDSWVNFNIVGLKLKVVF